MNSQKKTLFDYISRLFESMLKIRKEGVADLISELEYHNYAPLLIYVQIFLLSYIYNFSSKRMKKYKTFKQTFFSSNMHYYNIT